MVTFPLIWRQKQYFSTAHCHFVTSVAHFAMSLWLYISFLRHFSLITASLKS